MFSSCKTWSINFLIYLMFNIIFVVQVIDHMFITTDLLLHDYRDLGKFTSTMNLVEKITETCSSSNMPELENLQKTDSEPVWRIIYTTKFLIASQDLIYLAR